MFTSIYIVEEYFPRFMTSKNSSSSLWNKCILLKELHTHVKMFFHQNKLILFAMNCFGEYPALCAGRLTLLWISVHLSLYPPWLPFMEYFPFCFPFSLFFLVCFSWWLISTCILWNILCISGMLFPLWWSPLGKEGFFPPLFCSMLHLKKNLAVEMAIKHSLRKECVIAVRLFMLVLVPTAIHSLTGSLE